MPQILMRLIEFWFNPGGDFLRVILSHLWALIEFWRNHGAEFLNATLRHLALVAVSTGIAVAAGVPLGILSYRIPLVGAPLVGLANVLQTIPSIAMFGFLIP